MSNNFYGHYLVKETVAPEGFLLDGGVYSVFIEKDGETYTIENKVGIGFINDAMKGTLKIVKTSSDGKVEGFSFRVTGANGYDKIFVTDENGEIVIEGLRIGEYTVSEVANDVSAAYSRPADKKANVMTDSTTIVEMHNVLMDNAELRTAIMTLEDTQKKRIIKYFFDGKTYKQIAKEEGVSFQAVAKSIDNAVKKLMAAESNRPWQAAGSPER